MVQPDLIDLHRPGLDPEQLCRVTLKVDRDVAEADCPVPGVEQRASDDSHRIREVDDPCAVGRAAAHLVGDPEHDRNGPERFPEPACARRLLADAPAGERQRLVRQPGCLAADSNLDEHEVGAVDGSLELARHLEPPVEALALEHALREPADDVAPLRVDVVQDELADVDAVALARQARDELGRVRRARADDGDFQGTSPSLRSG